MSANLGCDWVIVSKIAESTDKHRNYIALVSLETKLNPTMLHIQSIVSVCVFFNWLWHSVLSNARLRKEVCPALEF